VKLSTMELIRKKRALGLRLVSAIPHASSWHESLLPVIVIEHEYTSIHAVRKHFSAG
jgi:hypothetical protein